MRLAKGLRTTNVQDTCANRMFDILPITAKQLVRLDQDGLIADKLIKSADKSINIIINIQKTDKHSWHVPSTRKNSMQFNLSSLTSVYFTFMNYVSVKY